MMQKYNLLLYLLNFKTC